MSGEPLLRVEHLKKYYPFTKGILLAKTLGHVKAVDDVSFTINPGETVGLVGESGCGKTTTSKLILNLEEPTEGRILLDGRPIHGLSGDALREYRAKVQAVFQDPWSSLNPRMTVGRTIAESLIVTGWGSRGDIDGRVSELLQQVGLRRDQATQYPHEFSGGQRQRIALAAALASEPQLIVLDEPVSALDVSIRAQMMNLLKDIQAQTNVAYLLVAHDLATVRHMADYTAVMYLGKIVEYGPTEALFDNVQHPYTKALFSAVLPPQPGSQEDEIELLGEVPSPLNPPPGCRFHTRCPFVMAQCSQDEPPLREIAPGHWAACHLHSGAAVMSERIHKAAVPAEMHGR
jgi:oligopeptide/dipeptide ABC transporter ATP-binding protein